MTTQEIVATNVAGVAPQLGGTVAVLTYTKVNATDTIEIGGDLPISAIHFAHAVLDNAGEADPLTWSGTTVTLSTGTGAGRILVVGI